MQLRDHIPALLKSLALNLVHRLCQFSITMFMYISLNMRAGLPLSSTIANGAKLLGAQAFISIGSTFIPIPGAMGYTDLMMLNAFGKLMNSSDAAGLELLTRSVSFYFNIILCFIIVAITAIKRKSRR